MKKFSKIAVVTMFVVVLIISSLSFVACNPEEPSNPFLLNGTPIKDYTIVYDDADIFAKHASNILASELKSLLGIDMSVVDDNAQEVDNEILVGKTERTQDENTSSPSFADYRVCALDSKIVLDGTSGAYMVGGAINYFVENVIGPSLQSNQVIFEEENGYHACQAVEADSVILMIGDGMGFNTIEMARQSGVFAHFSAESLPIKGEAVTRSYSVMIGEAEYTDSAASGTALATGYKTNNRVIGIDHEGNIVKNVRELAYENGAKTAIVTTDVLTGATPAAFYSHAPNRGNDYIISADLRDAERRGSLAYSYGYAGDKLLEMSKQALDIVSKDNSNFFIMIEEGYIDKTADDNDKDKLMDVMERWNDVIAYVIEFTLAHPGTVLIITADHETGGITLGEDGNYTFTTTDHTNVNVPVFAFGAGTEIFDGIATENIDIAKFIASVYSDEPFGGPLPTIA